MGIAEITNVLDALSQETRLRVFRIIVAHHHKGITPTEIATEMGNMPRNTLSFHLSLLTQANLCSYQKKGKTLIYMPICQTIKNLTEFLLQDCCIGECKC